MTSQLSFDNLADQFHVTPLTGSGTAAFDVQALPKFYVSPTLLTVSEEQDPEVTLISARGAAGKSRTAEVLSAQLRSPLWKLDLDQAVSGTALSFNLSRFMGQLNPFSSPPTNSAAEHLLLIDSLDEARARVSGLSWSQFVDSLALSAKNGLRLVLFGRERTLEDTWALLGDHGLRVQWLELSHFGDKETVEYIDGKASQSEFPPDFSNPLYADARDAVLSALKKSVPGETVDTFVGYAPVLDAVAAFFTRKPNLLKIRDEFLDEGSFDSRMSALVSILNQLLDREQAKVKPIAEDLHIEASLAFAPQEQIEWLCYDLEDAHEPGLDFLDSSIRSDYLDRIQEWRAVHPFRSENRWASPVFEAFVSALVFEKDVISGQRLIEVGNRSSLLFDFVRHRYTDLLLGEHQFAALHASATAAEWFEAEANVDISSLFGVHDAHPHLAGSISVASTTATRTTQFSLITALPSALDLHGPLSSLSVSFPGHVRVPARPSGSILGPDLYVRADSLTIEGDDVEFGRRATNLENSSVESVTLEVRRGLELPARITIPPLDGSFDIRVPANLVIHHPWVSYRVDLADEVESPSERSVRFLNMFMSLTRAHGHSGERGVFMKKLEGRQSLKNEKFEHAVSVLERHGAARRSNVLLYMSADWEKYRYSGKQADGQRSLDDVQEVWAPILREISTAL